MEPRARAFFELIRPHLRRLNVVAGHYVKSEEDAHDLVQETLLRAWRAFSAAEGGTYERAWFFTILRNIAAEWRRAAGRRIRLVPLSETQLTEVVGTEPWEPFARYPTLDEERFREFLDQRIAAALDALDPSFREVLILSVAGGMTYREIAVVLSCPIGTVMSRMGRARRALRERLAQYAQEHVRMRSGGP